MPKKKPVLDALQLPMFKAESSWRPPELSALPSWKGARRVSIDVETRDPQLKTLGPGVRRDGFIAGISFALSDGPAFYLPIRHFGGDNMPHDQVLYYLASEAREYTGEIAGANFQYDLDYLAEAGVVFPRVRRVRDIQIADPLLYELHASYKLESVLARWGYKGKDETVLRQAARDYGIDPKKDMWKLPARFVGPYAIGDVDRLDSLLTRQEDLLRQQDLWEVYELESKLQPILLEMRRRGVRINEDKLAQVETLTLAAEQADCAEISRRTGVRFGVGDCNKKGPKAAVLRELGVRWRETPTGQPQIDKGLLEQVDHPVAELMLHAGKVNKIRTTFCESVREHTVSGRIHATFNQLRQTRDDGDESGAKYGRMSCSAPNLQQQPARDPEFAKIWRSIYVPDEGLWCSADYSQQEPRMLVHFAELVGLDGARATGTQYRTNPRTDFHDMMTLMIYPHLANIDRKSEEFVSARKGAKTIALGLCYGMGSGKLAKSCGLPTIIKRRHDGSSFEIAGDEGQALLDKFDHAVPFVRKMAQLCEQRAKRNGFIRTISGRRCRFPTNAAGDFEWTHKALNRLIQGSSADQTKMAMVALHEAGFPLQLQVHDEVCLSVGTEDDAREVGRIMATCVDLLVPSRVDVEVGPSWGEAHGVD